MRSIKLIVFDMDKTLLNDDGKISDKTLSTLRNLKKCGYKLAIASGRNHFLVKIDEFNEDLIDYYICSNGSIIFDNEFNLIFKASISNETLEKLVDICVNNNISLLFNFLDGSYVYNNYKRIEDMILHWVGGIENLHDETIFKKHHKTENAFSGMIENAYDMEIFNSVPNIGYDLIFEDKYDIFVKGINKLTGIEKICEIINVPLNEVMAFGDNHNDYEMIKNVGVGISMRNGIDKIKSVAKYITSSNNEDGITEAVKLYNLI